MFRTYNEYLPEGESRAMDERDEVFYEYEREFARLGFKRIIDFMV